ncbi:chloramphenicol-sensitive protein RarD [Jatrophihabitans endophyticus]|uniref:Chloramphenicol-sensitive protein RarD n=1 Tax=Jatrophihabitans endophyticus TaxID=1206085 RepID=A0A1M5GUN3_9ACTN|nr:EamA family transporter RarD [Jatrophihabitans endophyticus]SHG07398.1 chloramphenicol-sensitive protein RarD [Jatrophihabitans endophyticus]
MEGERRRGLGYGAASYVLWGIFPLYFPLLEPAGTVEILASRMAWTLVVMLVVLAVSGGFSGFRAAMRNRRTLGLLAVAAVFITSNWATYIYGVNTGHVVETSLGYFINPLFTILLGVLVLGERLRRAQWAAVGIGTVAVAVIAIDYGRPPWIALILAFSFGMYGFCKKRADVGAADSLTVETTVLFVPALVVLGVVGAQGDLVFGTRWSTSLLLVTSGLVTAVPLLFFAAGTRRLPLSVLGLLQYLAPVLQFAVGVGIRHESLPVAELVGFVLVWIALVVLTVDGLHGQRTARQQARLGALG